MDSTPIPPPEQPATHRVPTPAEKLEAAMAQSTAELDAEQSAELANVDEQIETHAVAIDSLKARTIETILEIGQRLDEVHDLLAGDGRDGLFAPWVQKRCKFSRRTAYRYLDAHRAFGRKCATVAHLFAAMAVYTLSSDSCSKKATTEAIRRANKGEHITDKIAKELKAKHTPETKKATPEFDCERELSLLFEKVRGVMERWPSEHRPTAAKALNQLAKEATL